MTTLLERSKRNVKRVGVVCLTCAWLATRPPEEQAEWASVLSVSPDDLDTKAIARTMQEDGLEASWRSVHRHRIQRHSRSVA